MSASFNDPPYFGGLVNGNIRANVNQPLDLIQVSPYVPLPNAPTLISGGSSTSMTVALLPYGAPPQTADVKFFFQAFNGSPVAFTTSSYTTQPSGTGWFGFAVNQLTANTAYLVYAKSGVFTSPAITVEVKATTLTTNIVTTFLINGPRYNIPYSQALDYYINVDAVGCTYTVGGPLTAQGQQVFGSMIGKSTVSGGQPDYSGFCTSDQPYSLNFGAVSDAYLAKARSGATSGNASRLLTCWGGFNADILGLFGPNLDFILPTTDQVVGSFLYAFCNGNPVNNTLSWQNQGFATRFDGLILDFENVGYGGVPGTSNQWPPPQNPLPVFPADASNTKYSGYPDALKLIVTTWNSLAPTLFLGNAPVSLSINGDGLAGTRNGNICAPNTALNTWFAFPNSSTVPSDETYNDTASVALNHPAQMKYFDDIFVQFYNEEPDNYLGGKNFANLLAQWGFVALRAQGLPGAKKVKINIGLASGNIIPGFNLAGNAIVANAQGPTPPLTLPDQVANGPPYTYWYPQYATPSPPNSTSGAQSWPNTGPTLDGPNLASAINTANNILRTATSDLSIQPSDWCSGMGFWAGGDATKTAQQVYTGSDAISPGPILPAQNTYVWSDASYPAPNPGWVNGPVTLPIKNNL